MNFDYILLVESGCLLVAALGLAAVGRTDRPWRWLARFVIVQAAIDWLDLLAPGVLDPEVAFLLRGALTAIGCVALTEFAVTSSPVSRPRGWDWIPVVAAVVVTVLLRLLGTAWLGGALVLAGSAGGVAASRGLWRRSRQATGLAAQRLRLGALLLPPFATVSAWPAGGAAFAAGSGLSASGPAVALAMLFSTVLYVHCTIERRRLLPPATAAAWLRRRYLGIAGGALVLLLGGIAANSVGGAKDRAMRHEILQRTQLAAAAIPLDLVRALHWDQRDLAHPAYRELKALMTSLRLANPDLRFVMLIGFDAGRAAFLVDSESPDSPDYSPPGQAYDEAAPDYLATAHSDRPAVLGPITDRWGDWVVSSVPLLTLPDGRRIRFEIDVGAAAWSADIRRARLPVVLIVMLIGVLAAGAFVAMDRLHDSAIRLGTARDAAETATRAKTDFLAVMSHELRTPLAGIIGVIELLRRQPPAHLQNQYIAAAGDSAQTLLRLLDDLLDMAKIEAGKLRLESVPFRPAAEFRHLCEIARLRAEARGLDFHYHLDASTPEWLVGDPTRLRQVIANLQNNALKFTEAGEVAVTISASPRNRRSVHLRITVRDTGPGIDEATRQRLFQKFEQADASVTRRFGGTGLGLSIVKALADAMDGRVTLDSEPGRGSTFTFTAPLAIGEPGEPATDGETPAVAGPAVPLRILCAEDEPVNRLVAEGLLQQLNQSVRFAENGQAAVERLRREPFDLVLMDVRMPVMDGFKATQLIRSPHSGVLDPDVYICGATANASPADRLQCLGHGMDDYVAKPLRLATLAQVLQRAVDHLSARGPLPLAADAASPAAAPPTGSSAEPLPSPPDGQAASTGEPEDGLSEDFVQELRAIFFEEAPNQIAAMRRAFDDGDLPALAAAAHSLKSAAHYVAAHRLSRLAARLEADANAGQSAELGATLQLAEQDFAEFRQRHGCTAIT